MIWIAAATPWETRPLAGRLGLTASADGWRGEVSGAQVRLIETGMGAQAALAALEAAADSGVPGWLVLTGFAGAPASGGVAAGTLVVDLWGLEASAAEALRGAVAQRGLRAAWGRIASAERVPRRPAEKSAFGAARRALAVDLEAEAVRSWSEARGISFLAAKAVIDDLDQDVPVAVPAGRGPAAVGYALTHPGELPGMLRLWRARRRALAALASLLEVALPALSAPAGEGP